MVISASKSGVFKLLKPCQILNVCSMKVMFSYNTVCSCNKYIHDFLMVDKRELTLKQ